MPWSAEKLLSAAGDRACILPKPLFSSCSGRAALPVAPLPVLRATCPHAAPARAGSSSVPGSCCSSGRPGGARGSEETGGGSGCPGSEGPSADHLPLREPDRPPGAGPQSSAERRCCRLSPQKAGVEALTPSLASKPQRGWVGVTKRQDRTRSRTGAGVRGSGMRWEQKRRSLCRRWETPESSPAGTGGSAAPHPGDDGA